MSQNDGAPSGAPDFDSIREAISAIDLMKIADELVRLQVDHAFNLVLSYLDDNPADPNTLIASCAIPDVSQYQKSVIEMQRAAQERMTHSAKLTEQYMRQAAEACHTLISLRERNMALDTAGDKGE